VADIPEGSPERTAFEDNFKSSLVETLGSDVAGLSADDITILSISSGSIVVEYEITSTAMPDTAALASAVNTAVTEAAADPNSALNQNVGSVDIEASVMATLRFLCTRGTPCDLSGLDSYTSLALSPGTGCDPDLWTLSETLTVQGTEWTPLGTEPGSYKLCSSTAAASVAVIDVFGVENADLSCTLGQPCVVSLPGTLADGSPAFFLTS
jgi:hypothetical protein